MTNTSNIICAFYKVDLPLTKLTCDFNDTRPPALKVFSARPLACQHRKMMCNKFLTELVALLASQESVETLASATGGRTTMPSTASHEGPKQLPSDTHALVHGRDTWRSHSGAQASGSLSSHYSTELVPQSQTTPHLDI